jgi:DNA polymerase-3 subunit epsilon
MRQIVLDTETTGLSTAEGHRIIEIGCVEMINRQLTDKHYHQYINPQRAVDQGALEVHGISDDFLQIKPTFVEVVEEFLEFVDGAELIIHNAPFDVGFLDYELGLLDNEYQGIKQRCQILDTLLLAREMHPGQKNNLNALCKRYEVNNSQRELHGALLDAEILADVYLAMTGGQTDLLFFRDEEVSEEQKESRTLRNKQRPALKVVLANEEELVLHHKQLELLDKASGGECLWRKVERET